jgi:dTDP-4-amino-4,6-dideoxygalactose transaminase
MESKIPVIIPYFDHEEAAEVSKVLKSGWVAQGPAVAEFEKMVAAYENVSYGIAATSCTTALHLALDAMGLDENHDCVVPSFTFTASPNSVLYTGATPIFADVREDTYNIDPDSIELIIQERYRSEEGFLVNRITGRQLKTIMAVNLFGLCADLPRINAIAKKYGLSVLQDSACAFGAKIDDTMQADFGNTTCLSFHPRKSITTGEGGMVLTNDEDTARRMRAKRSHGASVSETDRHKNAGYLLPDFNELGYNYRMTDIQAAVGIAQMRKMGYITNTRREKARFYDKLIKDMNIDFLIPPYVPEGYYHTYQSYVCVVDIEKLGFKQGETEKASAFRNEIMRKLDENGIATRVGTHAAHMLGHYKKRYGFAPEDFKVSYMLDRLSITLPLYVQMTDNDQARVIDSLKNAWNELFGAR